MLCLLRLNLESSGRMQIETGQLWMRRWFGRRRLAGTQCGNLARGKDRVPGKSRNGDVELVGYDAQELRGLRPRLGGWESVVWLCGRPAVWMMKGALEINAGMALAGEKESFQAHRGGAVSYP